MAQNSSRTPLAGGALIALGAVGGTAIGLYSIGPTQGFLIGTAIGIAISVALWLLDVKR